MTVQSTANGYREPDGPAQIRISLVAGLVWSAVALTLAFAGLGIAAFFVVILVGGIIDTVVLDRWGRRPKTATPTASPSVPTAERMPDVADGSGPISRGAFDRLRRRIRGLRLDRDSIFVPSRRWWALSATCATACLVSINATPFFFLALPAIAHHFNAPFSELQWIVTAYVLAFGVAQILAVPITNTFGGRRVFRIGAWGLLIGSVVAGIAGDLTTMIVGRALQGVGAALATQGGNAIMEHAFVPEERRPALGSVYLTALLSRLFGPLVGGVLILAFGWRAVLYVGVPFALFAILVVQFAAPRPQSTVNRRAVDHLVPGSAFLGVAGASVLICLLLTTGWSNDGVHIACVVALALSVCGALALRVVLKWRIPHEYRFFFSRAYVGASLAEFTASFLSVSTLMYVIFFLVERHNDSVVTVGLYLMSTSAAFAIAYASIASMSLNVSPRFQLATALGALAVGLAFFQVTIASASGLVFLIPLFLIGYGSGLVVMPAFFAVRVVAPHVKQKIGSAMITTSGMLGSALGVAAFTAHLVGTFEQRSATTVAHQASHAFAGALQDNFRVGIAIGILVAVVSYLLIRDYDKRTLTRQNRAKEELAPALSESLST